MNKGVAMPGTSEKSVLRSRVKSVLHLLTGNLGNALVMIGSIAFATRALGPEAFGVLALTLAVGRVCERVVRFESWQPLVRYAATEEGASDPERMSRLYLFGLLLDAVGAVVAALLTVLAGFILTSFFDFPPEMVPLVAIYAIAIALNLRGMSSAVLRMAGMFRTMAYIVFLAGLLRLLLAAIFYWMGSGLMTFVWVWTICQVVDALIYNFIGFRQLARQGTPSPFRARMGNLHKDFPGFLGFAFTTNASSALRTITHEADTLIVGALTDSTEAAGFYHIAKRMAKVAMSSGEMIQMVVYPDLARMWAGKITESFRRTACCNPGRRDPGYNSGRQTNYRTGIRVRVYTGLCDPGRPAVRGVSHHAFGPIPVGLTGHEPPAICTWRVGMFDGCVPCHRHQYNSGLRCDWRKLCAYRVRCSQCDHAGCRNVEKPEAGFRFTGCARGLLSRRYA